MKFGHLNDNYKQEFYKNIKLDDDNAIMQTLGYVSTKEP